MSRRGLAALGLLPVALHACLPTSGAPIATQVFRTASPAPTATATPFLPLIPTFAAGPGVSVSTTATPSTLSILPVLSGAVEPIPMDADAVNVLLIGNDLKKGTGFRTDTLVVLSIQPSDRGAVLISIPRDLYVNIPTIGPQRINAAYLYGEQARYPGGGIALLEATILENLGLTIHHYARIDMDGFRTLVDRMQGIEVRVVCSYTDWRLKEPDLDPKPEENWELFTVKPGVVHMDGDTALWYARSRLKSTDLDRARRQQEILRGFYRQILRLDLIPRLPELYSDLTHAVDTDLTLPDLLRLARMGLRIDPSRLRSRFIGKDQVSSYTLPTSGAMVLMPNPEAIRALLVAAVDFETPQAEAPQRRVEVVNASGHADWADLATERLSYAGYQAGQVPGEEQVRVNSVLVDLGKGSPAEAEGLLRALGLPASSLVLEPEPSSPSDYRLMIGASYNPCFNPTRGQVTLGP